MSMGKLLAIRAHTEAMQLASRLRRSCNFDAQPEAFSSRHFITSLLSEFEIPSITKIMVNFPNVGGTRLVLIGSSKHGRELPFDRIAFDVPSGQLCDVWLTAVRIKWCRE